MKKVSFLLAALIVALFSSCDHREGSIKSEDGVVVEKQFQPSTKGIASGTGFNTNGDVTFSTHTITTKEQFCVVFKCEHGIVFFINRNELYANLDKGDSVTIFYYDVAHWGSSVVFDYDFIDARKKQNQLFNTDSLKHLLRQ